MIAVIFEVEPSAGRRDAYLSLAAELRLLLDPIDGFISTTKTMDIDFLVRNIRKPRERVNLVDAFQEKGYELSFRHTGVVTLIKDGFEVEFLAKQIGKPEPVVDSPNFGKLETLCHMSII